ncbi:MAG: hypothetical protein RIF41_30465, partial [Polyangiaceae bacterium]
AARAANLAERYLGRVQDLQETWREQLREHTDLRADAAAWAVIDDLPGHPVITVPVATAVTGRSKSSTAVAVDTLVDAGVLLPLSESKRNRTDPHLDRPHRTHRDDDHHSRRERVVAGAFRRGS